MLGTWDPSKWVELRPEPYPSRKLSFRRLGWLTHAFPGRRDYGMIRERGKEMVGGRTEEVCCR